MLIFCFLIRKGTSLCGTVSFDVFYVKISSGASAMGRRKSPKRSRVNILTRNFAHTGEKNPVQKVWLNFARG